MMTDRLHMTKMTWMDYARCTDRPIILPVGSTEQHGPHLPLGVDSIIAENFAALLAQRIDAVVAPTLSYGYKSKPFSGGGPLFPGTIDLNGSTLQALAADILLEFARDGFTRIFLMNAHFKNDPFLIEAMDSVNERLGGKATMLLSNWWDPLPEEMLPVLFDETPFPGWALEHAAITETSLMLYFAPELVRTPAISRCENVCPPAYALYPIPADAVPSSGVLASAWSSSAEKGQKIVEAVLPALEKMAREVFNL